MSTTNQPEPSEPAADTDKITFKRISGFVLGIIVGGLVLAVDILKSSPSEFHNTSKLVYISILIAFGIIGAIWGKKIIEKILGWLTWL